MKRLSVLLIMLILATSLCFSGCGETDRYHELTGFLDENEEHLSETFTEETCSFDMFSEYMASWSESLGITVAHTGRHSLILINPATENNEKSTATVMLCNLKTDDVQASIKLMATASTALMGPENHGKTVLIITEEKDGRYLGIDEVPDKYLKADNLINLQTSNNNTVLTSGPRSADCFFRKTGDKMVSQYGKAYEINLMIPEYTDPYDFVKGNNYPNPINTIGGILASMKSSGKLFDIASFNSESHEGYTPYSATAVIVIDENQSESLLNKFESSYDSIAEKFEKLETDFVYTCNETTVPETVLGENVSNNLISLMYTLNTGICMQDEDSGLIYAASYIKRISTSKSTLELDLGLRTRGQSYLDSIAEEYKTTAGLCSTKFRFSGNGFVWKSVEDSDLVNYFTEKVPLADDESDISLRTYENDIIYSKMPEQNMIIYAFESSDRTTVLDNIAHFLSTEEEN